MIRVISFMLILLLSELFAQGVIEFKIIGKDDGKRTNRDNDYNEALIDAKRKALEKAGIKIKSETQVLNFQIIKDFVESKSEGIILPGMEIFDLGYDENNYYKVMIIGNLKLSGETILHKKLRYVKLLAEKGDIEKAYMEISNIIDNSNDDELLEQALYYKIKLNLAKPYVSEEISPLLNRGIRGEKRKRKTSKWEKYEELKDTYKMLISYFPNSKYKEIANEELIKKRKEIEKEIVKEHSAKCVWAMENEFPPEEGPSSFFSGTSRGYIAHVYVSDSSSNSHEKLPPYGGWGANSLFDVEGYDISLDRCIKYFKTYVWGYTYLHLDTYYKFKIIILKFGNEYKKYTKDYVELPPKIIWLKTPTLTYDELMKLESEGEYYLLLHFHVTKNAEILDPKLVLVKNP